MLTRKSGPSKLTEKSKTSEFHSITFSLSVPSGVLYGGLFDHPDYLIYFLWNKVVFDWMTIGNTVKSCVRRTPHITGIVIGESQSIKVIRWWWRRRLYRCQPHSGSRVNYCMIINGALQKPMPLSIWSTAYCNTKRVQFRLLLFKVIHKTFSF